MRWGQKVGCDVSKATKIHLIHEFMKKKTMLKAAKNKCVAWILGTKFVWNGHNHPPSNLLPPCLYRWAILSEAGGVILLWYRPVCFSHLSANLFYTTKTARSVSKQSHFQPHYHSKAWGHWANNCKMVYVLWKPFKRSTHCRFAYFLFLVVIKSKSL